MGCGISTFNPVDDGMACGFRPLRRRIDEMRRSSDRTATLQRNPSSKLLLHAEEDATTAADSNDSRKGAVDDSRAVLALEPPPQINIRVKDDGETKKLGEEEKLERELETKEEDDYEEGRRISDFDGPLWIGSPSFREYCVHYHSDSDDSAGSSNGEKREKEIQAKIEKETQAKTETETQAKNALACNDKICVMQGSRKRSVKKGRRFRKVFPIHRSAAMKNFLNVSTCYTPKHSNVSSTQPAPGKLPNKVV